MEAKSSLKCTEELNQRFITLVKDLEGSDNATPEAVLKAMDVPDLTLSQIESLLQKHEADQQTRKDDLQAKKADLQTEKVDPQTMQIDPPANQAHDPQVKQTDESSKNKHGKDDLQAKKDDLQTEKVDPQAMQIDRPANQAHDPEVKQTDESSNNKHDESSKKGEAPGGESSNSEACRSSRTSSASLDVILAKPSHARFSLAAMVARFNFSRDRKEEEIKLRVMLEKLKELKNKVREMEQKIAAQAQHIEEITKEIYVHLHSKYGVTVLGVQDPSLDLTELQNLANLQPNATHLDPQSTEEKTPTPPLPPPLPSPNTTRQAIFPILQGQSSANDKKKGMEKYGEGEASGASRSQPRLFDLNMLPPLEFPDDPETD